MAIKTQKFNRGDQVKWYWGQGTTEGKIQEVYFDKITKKINGKDILRNASEDEPAYLIVQENGQEVLKSQSELHHYK